MASYRRRLTSDTWHWCKNCSNWPTRKGTFKERPTKPQSGDLCNECKAKRKAGKCQST
jgi:hypothetical protein